MFKYVNRIVFLALLITVPLFVSAQQPGNQTIPAAGGGTSSPISGGTVIDPTASPYNVVPGFSIPDATFTNGQNTIDCTFSNDCNFSASKMNGWQCWGTNQTSDTSAMTSTVILPQGLLTVTDAQHATCSGGNSTQSTTHNGVFVTGPKSDAGITSAWNATIAACGTMLMPAAPVIVSKAQGNATNTKCTNSNPGYGAYSIVGWGPTTSTFIPTPDFDPTTCTGGSGATCFFGAQSMHLYDVGIYGGGINSCGSGFNGKVAAEGQGGAGLSNFYWFDVTLFSWCAAQTQFIGLQAANMSDATFKSVLNDGVGGIGCNFTNAAGTALQLINVYCANNAKQPVESSIGGRLFSTMGVYGSTLTTTTTPSTVWTTTGSGAGNGVVFSNHDVYDYTTESAQAQIQCIGECHFTDDYISNPTGSAFGITGGNGSTASKIYLTGNRFNIASGTCFIGNAGGVTFFDQGGNSEAPGTNCATGFTPNGGTIAADGHSFTAVGTGTCSASVTIGLRVSGLSTAGTAIPTTCTSTTLDAGVPMTAPRTLMNLVVTSSAVGVSGVVTVLKNGGATTLTCSMAGVTTCSDGTHAVSVVAGDLISVQVATGAAETLANVKAFVEWN